MPGKTRKSKGGEKRVDGIFFGILILLVSRYDLIATRLKRTRDGRREEEEEDRHPPRPDELEVL